MLRWSLALTGTLMLACGSFGAADLPDSPDAARVNPALTATAPTVWRGIPLPLDGGVLTEDPFREGDEDYIAIAHEGVEKRAILDSYTAHAQQYGWVVGTAHVVGGARLVRDGEVVQLGAISLVGDTGVLVLFSEGVAE